ncbi:4-hydroxy-tetrahydrodipicolinate reductase [Candidatus Epulonipiscium viviparus]|uniref:4-hydroxy-tetrahydrodipicolinate reductase n=1 Tax=Candidatus Epulonipiscium viviparus TaxID=420336 RepID=UPI0027380FBA|nr:4-hydroxy-tetrahydrodipicolinate reductase [Candidatus Epulopiscium viviparus]
MIKILMHGCNGKIGRVITELAKDAEGLEIVAGVDINQTIANDYPVFAALAECDKNIDVIIDFSTAAAVNGVLEFAKEKKIPVVVCTTGLSAEQKEMLVQTSESVAVFFSSNMSIGVNLLIELAKRATKALVPEGFDVEIVEKHHNRKIDAPSGTALSIAEAIQDVIDKEYAIVFDRSKVRQARNKNEIGVHAVRGGTIVGEHDVIYAGVDEVITLSHSASSRDVFAIGALRAAKYVANKGAGLYNMENLLGKE